MGLCLQRCCREDKNERVFAILAFTESLVVLRMLDCVVAILNPRGLVFVVGTVGRFTFLRAVPVDRCSCHCKLVSRRHRFVHALAASTGRFVRGKPTFECHENSKGSKMARCSNAVRIVASAAVVLAECPALFVIGGRPLLRRLPLCSIVVSSDNSSASRKKKLQISSPVLCLRKNVVVACRRCLLS